METSTNLKFILNRPAEQEKPGGDENQNTPGGDENQNTPGGDGNSNTPGGNSNNIAPNGSTNRPTNSSSGQTIYTTDNSTIAVPNTGERVSAAKTSGQSALLPIFIGLFIVAAVAIVAKAIGKQRKSHLRFSDDASKLGISPLQISLVGSSTFALLFVGMSLINNASIENQKTADAASSLAISSLNNIEKKIEDHFDDSNFAYVAEDTVKVEADTNAGYRVFVQAESDKLYLDGDSESKDFFSPAADGKLQDGAWGYRVGEAESWAAISTTPAEIANIAATENETNSSETKVYYGVNPTDELKNGSYSTKITYTVVADEPELVTMQDFNPDSLANGESTTLVDARDGNRYTVKKLGSGADAEVWMTSNLTLGYDQSADAPKGLALTSADTNIPASDTTTYYLPPAGYQGSITSSSTMTSTTAADFSSSSDDQARVQYAAASATGSTNPQPTGYYNFYAATLGFSYYNDGKTSGTSTKDICPKGWQLPRGYNTATYSFYWLDIALGGTGANRADTTTRDRYISDFALPYSGSYDGSLLNFVDSYGFYWSSTVANTYSGYYLYVNSSGGVYPQNSNAKYSGFAVRCVAKEPTMQDFDPSSLAEGASTTLTDARDGNKYTVKKFGTGADAEVWMTSNLTLGYDQSADAPKGLALTSADTNIPADDTTTYYLPPAGYQGSITSSSTMTSTTAASFLPSSDDQARVQYAATSQTGSTNPQPTGYYNFNAASLGYSGYDTGASSGDTPRDICPKGWQLPRGSSTATYSFYWLDRALGGTGANRLGDTTTRDRYISDFALPYSGEYYNSLPDLVGLGGRWWSSTVYDIRNSDNLYIYSDGKIYPQDGNDKYYGYAVRCVSKS